MLFEFHKGRTIRYEADPETTDLVELDEEPPHRLNEEAIDIALTISALFKARPMDEIHVMRKVVIDGSNTTGFQRTAIISLNGRLKVDGKEIPIQQITLEEDSGRKTGEGKNSVTFRLDRLGVPLIEISTGADINHPEEAGKVAFAIGKMLRASKRVKRGLGSIRQDLNVSIKNGALIEIKGVQELELVAKVVELEVTRQTILLQIRDELRTRNLKPADFSDNFVNLTEQLSSSQSNVIQSALKNGGFVLGTRLPGFKGLLKQELMPGVRLGTELAKRAVFWGRVGGIFHSDELPGHGISESEVEAIYRRLECGPSDAFVLIADSKENVLDGLKAVLERAKEALAGVPEETRTANPDGTTQYMRPRPGPARMYPETDVPPVQIGPERIIRIAENLPRMPEEVAKELGSKYDVGPKLAGELVNSDYLGTFEHIVTSSELVNSDYLGTFEHIVTSTKGVSPSFVATVLTGSLRNLERENVPIENVTDSHLREIFNLVGEQKTAKESVIDIIKWVSSNPNAPARDALGKLNLEMLTEEQLSEIISRILESSRSFVKENGAKALGKMMNLVMGEVRGRADPKLVTELLRTRLEQFKG